MHIIDPGHHYLVDSYDGSFQEDIIFMKRMGGNYPGNTDKHGGTNCQELIRVLIDRVKYLDNQKPCDSNKEILKDLRHALYCFESRAFQENPEGKRWPYSSMNTIETLPTCSHCGHIACRYL